MDLITWIVLILALIIIGILAFQRYMLLKALKEIQVQMKEILDSKSNNLITISSANKKVRAFVCELNSQLKQIRQQRQLLEYGDRELKSTIVNIAHDLRSPLTAISGYVQLLKRQEPNELLDLMDNRLDAITSLTSDLFNYSIWVSQDKLKKESVDINAVLKQCLLDSYSLFKSANIIPRIELLENPVIRTLDKMALCRVFENIISNACKYAQESINITMQSDGSICFSNKTKDLTTLDVGRLFDRFYTVSSAKNSTGLGLSIAKLLTERMGGKISASLEHQWLSINLSFEIDCKK